MKATPMNRIRALVLAACLGGGAITAEAHAFLDHADPPVGAALAKSPASVKIWFTEEVEPAFSVIVVRNAAGTEVDSRDSRVDPGHGTLLIVSLPALPQGVYKVAWKVVAKDTHKTEGTFPFTVEP